MNMKQVNEVLEKLSKEVTKLNNELNENITIFYEDNGSFNHVIFIRKENEEFGVISYFELYYKPSFYLNISEHEGIDTRDIVDRIQEIDDTMTKKDIENYLNSNYQVDDWAFETCIRVYDSDVEYFNLINDSNIDNVVNEIIEDIKYYLDME